MAISSILSRTGRPPTLWPYRGMPLSTSLCRSANISNRSAAPAAPCPAQMLSGVTRPSPGFGTASWVSIWGVNNVNPRPNPAALSASRCHRREGERFNSVPVRRPPRAAHAPITAFPFTVPQLAYFSINECPPFPAFALAARAKHPPSFPRRSVSAFERPPARSAGHPAAQLFISTIRRRGRLPQPGTPNASRGHRGRRQGRRGQLVVPMGVFFTAPCHTLLETSTCTSFEGAVIKAPKPSTARRSAGPIGFVQEPRAEASAVTGAPTRSLSPATSSMRCAHALATIDGSGTEHWWIVLRAARMAKTRASLTRRLPPARPLVVHRPRERLPSRHHAANSSNVFIRVVTSSPEHIAASNHRAA